MRGNATIATDINEKWLLEQYNSHTTGLFADTYNELGQNIFTVTSKKILSTVDDVYKEKLQRKYSWDWGKEYDNGTRYTFETELMDFSLNSRGEVIATLTDTYLDRKDAEIPTMKYAYFFSKDSELKMTVPNQGDDGLGLAYVNDQGELIIDNNQY